MSTTKVTDSMRDVTVVDAAKITTGAVPAAALSNVDLVEGTKGADIASAGTMVIGTDGGYFDITGTTGITAMTVAAGRVFTLQFDGIVTLTHSSTLYLSGAANFTTEANDHMTFISVAANDVRQIGTGLKDGGSPVAAGGVSVAFSAQLSGAQSDVTGNGAVYSVTGAIWTEIYDVGSAFVNGTYTAQSTGQHLLSGIWSIENINSGSRTKWELVTSNRNYVIFDGQSESFETSATGGACMAWSQQCDMDTSDTAYTRVTVVGMGANTADMPVIGNRFQGFQFI
jgi:hypothetical protein